MSAAGLPEFEYSQITGSLWAGRNPLFERDVARLARVGIRHILDLREPAEWAPPRFGQEALDALPRYGIRRTHLQIDDQTAPDDDTLTAAVALIQAAVESGEALYVHCRAGMERTAAVLMAWRAATHGESCGEALKALWVRRPILAPMAHQWDAVERWLQRQRRHPSLSTEGGGENQSA